MTQVGECLMAASLPTHLLSMKATTKVGTWNVRTMYETGKAAQVANEMKRYNIQVLGICECRWNGSGLTTLATGEKIVYSGHAEENHDHTEGVAIMMSPAAANAPMERQPCYAPTNDADGETNETFYDALQTVADELPKRDIKLLSGDMNAKIGKTNTGKKLIMGTQALGDMNENGELFTDFCAFNNLDIGDTTFQHKDIHKVTWISPDGKKPDRLHHYLKKVETQPA
ncbi:craniofacial development protein 2-like [Dreissena polymorpha]|uniref:craniofacial development protein 2-like n=1 Tax=Dreissena polymorpha TaxID=45954 RepID=UPI00226467D1|nr:craniofacial development protein 2-like [Dreissena polymorpha]